MLKKRGGSPSPLMNATAREWEGNRQRKALFLLKLWETAVPCMKVKTQQKFSCLTTKLGQSLAPNRTEERGGGRGQIASLLFPPSSSHERGKGRDETAAAFALDERGER